jgi:hypothetical protein
MVTAEPGNNNGKDFLRDEKSMIEILYIDQFKYAEWDMSS